MEILYETHFSQYLGRTMEYKVYGGQGLPCIAFAPEGGRFFDWEDHGMTAAAARWIEEGKLTLLCPDSLDGQTFLAQGDVRPRAELHERWVCYLTREFLPQVQALFPEQKPLLVGCGLGAAHAVSLYLRYPQQFCQVIGLSGLYDTQRFFGKTQDDLVFRSSPLCTLPALPESSAVLQTLRQGAPLILCSGQGQGAEADALADCQALAAVLEQQCVPCCTDAWGFDVTHDWHWWAKQLEFFLDTQIFPAV